MHTMRFGRFFPALMIIVVAGILLPASAGADETPEMLFFYSDNCEHCKIVREDFLPGFLERYGSVIDFREIMVSEPGNIDSLIALESRVGVPEDSKDYPAVYFLGVMIEGEIPIRMRLAHLVETYLANPDSMRALHEEVMARSPESFTAEPVDAAEPVYMAYFYKQGCQECSRAEEIIDWLNGNYEFLTVDVFDIGETRAKLLAAALGLRAGIPENRLMGTPVFFVGDDFVLSEDISRERLAGLVQTYARSGSDPFWRGLTDSDLEQANRYVAYLFERFTVLAVALAGLGDGINPCAFATILFFVSYLGMIGRKRNEILLVGLAFAFSVFFTYFMVGLGFFGIVRSLSHFELISKIIFGGTGVLCIVFGLLSIQDYFKARSGNTAGMSLQLPAVLKRRIHATIREKSRTKSFVIGAFAAGFMVSILELACTGQVYLPTITLMVRQEGGVLPFVYLLLYNICFIIPLLVVFGFVYFGMSSKGIAKVMETRVGTVKLLLALIFFILGGLLIWTVL